MTALEASSVRVRTMADGTLRAELDFEPRFAAAAFRLLGSPGHPLAVAALKIKTDTAADDKPKGGALARLAGQWCNDDKFCRWIRPVYSRHMGGNGHNWGDVTPDDFGGGTKGQAGYCRHAILVLCDITSRAELDHDSDAAARFHQLIREPFAEYLKDHP